jgi:hypothetical protein
MFTYSYLFIPFPRFVQWEWFEVGSVPYQKCSMLALFLAQHRKRKRGYCQVFWKRKSLRWNFLMSLLPWRCFPSCYFSDDIIFQNLDKSERQDPTKFALVWNQIINSFRSEDLISNRYVLIISVQQKSSGLFLYPFTFHWFCREMDLMTMPMSLEYSSASIRWPLFLLAKKVCGSIIDTSQSMAWVQYTLLF